MHRFSTPAPRRRTLTLSQAEVLILWSMRVWARGARTDTCIAPLLMEAYASVQATAAVEPFDLMMQALYHSAISPLQIRCAPCRKLTADEAAVLAALALHQAGLDDQARDRICPLLRPRTAPGVTPYLNLTAWALLASGLRLPLGGAISMSGSANENADPWGMGRPVTLH